MVIGARGLREGKVSCRFPGACRCPTVAHYFTDARNVVAFVDGHVSYIKIYFDPSKQQEAWQYDPPSKYDYRWSAE